MYPFRLKHGFVKKNAVKSKRPGSWFVWFSIIASARQNKQSDLWVHRRLKSTWASTQSHRRLRCPHEEAFGQRRLWLDWALRRLFWGFAGRSCHFVGFVMLRHENIHVELTNILLFVKSRWRIYFHVYPVLLKADGTATDCSSTDSNCPASATCATTICNCDAGWIHDGNGLCTGKKA